MVLLSPLTTPVVYDQVKTGSLELQAGTDGVGRELKRSLVRGVGTLISLTGKDKKLFNIAKIYFIYITSPWFI